MMEMDKFIIYNFIWQNSISVELMSEKNYYQLSFNYVLIQLKMLRMPSLLELLIKIRNFFISIKSIKKYYIYLQIDVK